MYYAVGLFVLLLGIIAVSVYRRGLEPAASNQPAETDATNDADEASSSDEDVVDATKKHWLVGKTGSVRGKVYHIGQRTVTIGRKPTNFIQLPDEEVSRIHCQFQWTPDGMTVSDLDSTVGTQVDGEKIATNTDESLDDGSLIQVGDAEFIYHREGDFETNYEFIEQKAKGQKFEAITAVKSSGEWKRAILAELERADGDPETAAENIGIEKAAFDKLMEEQGITEQELAEL